MKRNSEDDIAIMIFSRKAREEHCYKRFTTYGRTTTEQRIAQLLIRHMQEVATSTGLPVYTVSSALQQGETFGERFTHAIQSIFDKGFQKVIAIGNDCLSLDRHLLLQARQQLTTRDVVVGPASDGGIYLLGISVAAFHSEQLANIRWQTSHLFEDIVRYAHTHLLEWTAFQELSDIDNPQSLLNALKAIPAGNTLYRQIINLLFFLPQQLPVAPCCGHTAYVLIQPFRGPPALKSIRS